MSVSGGGAEQDLFGAHPPSPPPAPARPRLRAVRRGAWAMPAPAGLGIVSPGTRFDAEAYLADVTGGETLTYGGVLVTWPDGTRWAFMAGENPHQTMGTEGIALFSQYDIDRARQEAAEEGEEDGREEALKEAAVEMERAVGTAVAKTAELLLARIPAPCWYRRVGKRCSRRCPKGERRAEPVARIELEDWERADLERDAIDAEWGLTTIERPRLAGGRPKHRG